MQQGLGQQVLGQQDLHPHFGLQGCGQGCGQGFGHSCFGHGGGGQGFGHGFGHAGCGQQGFGQQLPQPPHPADKLVALPNPRAATVTPNTIDLNKFVIVITPNYEESSYL